MGLLTILKKMKQKEKEVRILMFFARRGDSSTFTLKKLIAWNLFRTLQNADGLIQGGLDNAGKTTIVKKFNGEDISTISPTLGFSIKTLEHRGFKLNIWDVGGQKSLRSYWRNYFESTDGLIWVVDSADRRRLQDCRQELDGLLVEERLAGATLLVFANKQDLPGALSPDAIKEAMDLDNLKTHHCVVFGCSAVTGENLLTGVDWLIDDIASRIFTLD